MLLMFPASSGTGFVVFFSIMSTNTTNSYQLPTYYNQSFSHSILLSCYASQHLCHPQIRVFFTSLVPPTSENSCQTASHHPTCCLCQLGCFPSTTFLYSSMSLYKAFSPCTRVQKQFTHSHLRLSQLLSSLFSSA